MTIEEFKALAKIHYSDLICDNANENVDCVDCTGITSLDIANAENYILANINLKQKVCCRCQKDVDKLINQAIVYAVLIERLYAPEYEGLSVKRMINDFLYNKGLVHFG